MKAAPWCIPGRLQERVRATGPWTHPCGSRLAIENRQNPLQGLQRKGPPAQHRVREIWNIWRYHRTPIGMPVTAARDPDSTPGTLSGSRASLLVPAA
jgi:hypothetical protein